MSGPIRVVLVDDQTLVRAGLRALLAAEPDIEVVGEAADGTSAVQVVRACRPSVVLMDVRMPHRDGLAATADIVADPALSGVRVVILTTFELDEYVLPALRGGACGFLLKDAEPVDLLRGVRSAARGEALLAPSVAARLIRAFAATPGGPSTGDRNAELARLTDREREVVALAGCGMSNEDIAAHLVISPATARTHVSRAMIKLAARDRAQLVVFAYEAGLVMPGRRAL
ncbi:DNA-binding response regulator, NarL/FixJ family, contains REC and HTH domains [Micromonospora phaseoli]|uniref:DNA-binding response regulator, NarL/FixJ family, contains REC and HTH domains n=1 Tax=Micromonospora phaseoli TaxID=1144548 RepID=A0A1H7DXG0_9ACTN|nr:response regulator transcription factor [Micromonospora phaseoli]PZV88981.1 LuxR family two component transcriptional regulator [Micromonospora phaseoli]GIJ80975.1 DNA-binding response regulator [Micromonospora phaseoli]SEK06459.1 DNA-binding response regulator, NarL/FixJ family, contains REC and HTH domains [Micromonospora phaseoli]